MTFEISHHSQLLSQVSAKPVDYNFWPLEHFLRQWHLTRLRAFHKLLGNFLATSRISSNFLHSEQFLKLSTNSEISEKFLVLNWSFFHISHRFSRQFMNFLWKGDKSPPRADHELKRKDIGLLGQWFLEKFKMVDEDSPDSHSTDLSISGEEGHWTILLAHYIFWS